jgi:hypothetical protein
MDEKTVRQIEKETGRRINVVLPVEYREKRVGRYNVPVPYQRFKLVGERQFRTREISR